MWLMRILPLLSDVAVLLPLAAIALSPAPGVTGARRLAAVALAIAGLASVMLAGRLWLPTLAAMLALLALTARQPLPMPPRAAALAMPLAKASLALAILLVVALLSLIPATSP